MQRGCRKVVLTGEVTAGQPWSEEIGQGWFFRLVPIAPLDRGYTGWDLAVDRDTGGGYPDALLVATPPYGSLNEREVGTTFGLRAQDAIAWSPRRFHYLIAPKDLARAKVLFAQVNGADAQQQRVASAELLAMVGDASRVGAGQFAVTDARLTAGAGDPAKFAEQWALHLPQVPHTLEQAAGAASARGELRWIRFTATLWLPAGWKLPPATRSEAANCAE